MSFRFVDHSDINHKARKLIRSHVMKGKNSGKTRAKRDENPKPAADKPAIACRTVNVPRGNDIPITALGHPQSNSAFLAVTRQIANNLDLVSPTKIAPQAMLHLQQLAFYILDISSPPVFCQTTGVTGWMWFQLAFRDEAYFHCNVAIASACAAFLTEDSYHSPVALYHMSQAYRLVNQRLSSNEALSDNTIAVVAAINIYDRLYGDPHRAMIHLNGVTRMIALRGGIGELAKRKFLIAEKALRCDMELALHCGSKPKYSSGDVPRHLVLISQRDHLGPQTRESMRVLESILCQSVCVELREAVFDTLSLSRILSQASHAQKLDPEAYQGTLIYVCYRLLENQLHHDESSVSASFDILVQMALFGFLITFCFGVGRKLITFPLVMERFRSVGRAACGDGRPRKMVLFWALLMGRVSSLTNGDDVVWLVPKLKALADALELRAWRDVSDALRGFPWVKAAHEVPGEEFWNMALALPLPCKPIES